MRLILLSLVFTVIWDYNGHLRQAEILYKYSLSVDLQHGPLLGFLGHRLRGLDGEQEPR